MNLGHLRRFLATAEVTALPDTTEVGCEGHYGEFCPAYNELKVATLKRGPSNYSKVLAVVLPSVYIGPEPD